MSFIFQKIPPLLICDDACTFVSHSLQRYPVEAQLAYGEKRGCFEKPQEDTLPQENISCPDITPIELSTREVNKEAMRNKSPLVHPDVSTSTRYVSGTRQVNIVSQSSLIEILVLQYNTCPALLATLIYIHIHAHKVFSLGYKCGRKAVLTRRILASFMICPNARKGL